MTPDELRQNDYLTDPSVAALRGDSGKDGISARVLLGLLLITALLLVSCARRSANAELQDSLVYIAVGDSTGVGLGARDGGGYVDSLFARIKQQRTDAILINLSAAGATTAAALNKQINQVNGKRMTLVTVCIGLNDLLHGVELEQFAENYEALVARLQQTGVIVVIANLPDVTAAPALRGLADESLGSRLGQFNQTIEKIARQHGLPLVDLYKLSRDADSQTLSDDKANGEKSSGRQTRSRPELISSDGLHPSELGYERWADALWAAVEPAIHEHRLRTQL
jgi:acyl-CoA thioesterase-1